jgi:hypothetical protein
MDYAGMTSVIAEQDMKGLTVGGGLSARMIVI